MACVSACGGAPPDEDELYAAVGSVAESLIVNPPPPSVPGDYRSIRETRVILPAAGGSFYDPDFKKTKIIRVTDEKTKYGAPCYHAYATVPAWSSDSSRLLIACGNEPLLFTFDRAADKVRADGTLAAGQPYVIDWENAFWSGHDRNVLYALGRPASASRVTTLYRIDVTKKGQGRFTVVRDFSSWWPGNGWELRHLSVSNNDNVFSFHARWPDGSYYRTGAFIRNQNRLLTFPKHRFTVDESAVDKLGRNVYVFGTGLDDFRVAVWDLQRPWTAKMLERGPADRTGGHHDIGAQLSVNGDLYDYGVVVRPNTEAGVKQPRNVFRYRTADGTLNWGIAHHVSLRNSDERFFVLSTYGVRDHTWPPFQGEIVVVKTDGSGFTRVAHTRAVQHFGDGAYWDEPRAVVDKSGRYVVFDSNHGTHRTDVFIAKLP